MAKILLVEDDIFIAQALTLRLEHEGYEVQHVSDVLTATVVIQNIVPDLVLLDISILGGTGFDVSEFIRTKDDISHIPVIFVTADNSRKVVDEAKKLSCSYLFHKPFNKHELIETIGTVLETKGMQA